MGTKCPLNDTNNSKFLPYGDMGKKNTFHITTIMITTQRNNNIGITFSSWMIKNIDSQSEHY